MTTRSSTRRSSTKKTPPANDKSDDIVGVLVSIHSPDAIDASKNDPPESTQTTMSSTVPQDEPMSQLTQSQDDDDAKSSSTKCKLSNTLDFRKKNSTSPN